MQGLRRAMTASGDEGEGGRGGPGLIGPDTRWGGYPYEVIRLGEGQASEVLVALAATPMTAFAAYYAAVREHLGSTVVLKHNGRVIQHARPRGSPA